MPNLLRTAFVVYVAALIANASFAQAPGVPLPDVRQLMKEVQAHQKQLERVRESYTYSTSQTIQDLDAKGNVVKSEMLEKEDFFVNGHVIERLVQKNGKPLDDRDASKEAERVTRLVQKAQRTPPGQPLEGQTVSTMRLLDIMQVSAPRRETFRGRPTIVFDFSGFKDAKTHGILEDASKKVRGRIWIDEADRQVAHLEAEFFDNFKVAGGVVANLQKGSNFKFDQGRVEEGLWLPTGAEANTAVRVLLLKNIRQHFTERVHDYKRFNVDAQQQKDAKIAPSKP